MYHEMFLQFRKMLGQIDRWLDVAVAHAERKPFDPKVYLTLRLAPDQFPLVRQIQTACDTAKLAAARLTGKVPPSHPDTEQTVDELKARLRAVMDYLATYKAQDFADAATRAIVNPRWEGKVMLGADYFREHAVPNFFFHVTHTYAILRHAGVELGKTDYLGSLSLRAP
jgi:hypothetical protein